MTRAYRPAAANEISAGACAAEVSATANEGTAAEVTAAANEGTAAISAAEVTATAAAAMAAAKGEGGIRNRDCRPSFVAPSLRPIETKQREPFRRSRTGARQCVR